jgi:hypothetical protein
MEIGKWKMEIKWDGWMDDAFNKGATELASLQKYLILKIPKFPKIRKFSKGIKNKIKKSVKMRELLSVQEIFVILWHFNFYCSLS